MSEFIKIKPVGDTLTGDKFFIQSFNPNDKATITSLGGESLFTTELKEGDIVCFYNFQYDRNPIKVEYTVDSITSDTVFIAKEISKSKIGNSYYRANKKIDTHYIKYPEKRLLTSSIVGYKKDPNSPGIVLLDTDESLADSKEYNFVSTNTPVEFGGLTASQKYISIGGQYNGLASSDYRVKIQTVGVQDVCTVTCVADSGGSLDGKAFYFHTVNNKYMVIIHVRKADTVPIDGVQRYGARMVGIHDIFNVSIDAGDTNAEVATAVYNRLLHTNEVYDGTARTRAKDFTVSNLSSNTFKITCNSKGLITAPSDASPEMTSRSSGISFKSVNGISSFTDTNWESDGLSSVTWSEWDKIYIENSEKNNIVCTVHSVTDGTVVIKEDKFVNEDAGYDVIVRNLSFSGGSGFSFADTTTGVNDKFQWSDTNGDIWNEQNVAIKNVNYLNNGVRIKLLPNNYVVNDYWTFSFPKPTMIKTENTIEELDNIYKCTNIC